MEHQRTYNLYDIISAFVGRIEAAGISEWDEPTLNNVEYAGTEIATYLRSMFRYARLEYDRHEGSMHDIGAKKLEIIQEMHQMFQDLMGDFEDILTKE